MEKSEIRWSIMALLLAAGLVVVDSICRILRAPLLKMEKLKALLIESLAKELVPCKNFLAVCVVQLKLMMVRYSWYRLANNSRILVSYNGRVQLQAPLSEWMKWAQMLDKDEMSSGRVVYRNAKFIRRLAGERGVRRADPPTVEKVNT